MKRILLATDGSPLAQDAAAFLAHLPHDDKIELCVCTALFVPATPNADVTGDWIEACLAQERQLAADAYAKIERLFEGANVSLRHIVRVGDPGETIVSVAAELQTELLVIGAKGHSAIARVLLGSTSDYVATHAPCSVLVVRPHPALKENHRLRVVIGYEESGPAQAAIEEFAEFGWGGQTDTRVVSIVYDPGFYDVPFESPSPASVESAAKQLREVAPGAKGCLIHSAHIGEGLVNYVESNNIDLLVVGETPRNRLGRVLMGSMTRFVLRHAPCSVWITRNRMIRGAKKTLAHQEATTT